MGIWAKRFYGFLCILLLLPVLVQAVEIKGFVNDDANILTPQEKSSIEQLLQGLFDAGIAQVSIVTVQSLQGQDIDSFSLNLAQGHLGETGKNNGLLLVVALEEREYRFEVGRGLEPILPDSLIGRIGRSYLVPNFKEGNYGKGIQEAILAVDAVLRDQKNSSYFVKNSGWDKSDYIALAIFIAVALIIIIGVIRQAGNPSFRNDPYSRRRRPPIVLGSPRMGSSRGFGRGGFGGGGAGGKW